MWFSSSLKESGGGVSYNNDKSLIVVSYYNSLTLPIPVSRGGRGKREEGRHAPVQSSWGAGSYSDSAYVLAGGLDCEGAWLQIGWHSHSHAAPCMHIH